MLEGLGGTHILCFCRCRNYDDVLLQFICFPLEGNFDIDAGDGDGGTIFTIYFFFIYIYIYILFFDYFLIDFNCFYFFVLRLIVAVMVLLGHRATLYVAPRPSW